MSKNRLLPLLCCFYIGSNQAGDQTANTKPLRSDQIVHRVGDESRTNDLTRLIDTIKSSVTSIAAIIPLHSSKAQQQKIPELLDGLPVLLLDEMSYSRDAVKYKDEYEQRRGQLEQLVVDGADPNARSHASTDSAFLLAIKKDDCQFAKVCLAKGGNVHDRFSTGQTVLERARSVPLAQLLITYGAALEDKSTGLTVLHTAAESLYSSKLLVFYCNEGLAVKKDRFNNSALHALCYAVQGWPATKLSDKFFKRVAILSYAGADHTTPNSNGKKPSDLLDQLAHAQFDATVEAASTVRTIKMIGSLSPLWTLDCWPAIKSQAEYLQKQQH